MAGNVGAMQLSALAREFENACTSGDTDVVERLAAELTTASAMVTKALAARVEGTPVQGPAATAGKTG
jgi:HPt (histidine-containing phosphotransfer) domain-containing protein